MSQPPANIFVPPVVHRIGAARQPAGQAFHDACCAAANSAPAPAKRTRLAELDANLHCSIIGTCLTTGELRKLAPRHAPQLDRQKASDLEIHHAAVQLSTDGGVAAKEMHKALDARHELALKRFKGATGEAALRALWTAALASGDVPGAYWALLTHPSVTPALRQLAFGDVHMLSHLVGASNRADIRRLAALEAECGELKEINQRQQARLHDAGLRHELSQRQLERQTLELAARSLPQPAQDVGQLRHMLAEREQKLALHDARGIEAQQRLQAHEDAAKVLNATLARLGNEACNARAEIQALEQALARALSSDTQSSPLRLLAGKTIAYIGGRPGCAATLDKLVSNAGGTLLLHDGGIEERKGLLETMLPRASMVLFPVDCISHNAMHIIKRVCERHAIACHPLRSASVASFVELIGRLEAEEQAIAASAAAPRFCLHHG